ncbi:MAG: peptidylprolyl isomerase, partial [Gemmatimonadaceae bacterium]
WRRDSAHFTPALVASLRGLRAPPEASARAAAKGITPLGGWGSASAVSRPLDWYEARVKSILMPSLDGRAPRAAIVTERGTVMLELLGGDAPLTVDNFMALARSGFYNHGAFHRVVPNFVAQDGDPRGDGNGGPPYAIRDELNRWRYVRGAVGMALSGPDTGGSQYFLTLSPQPHLDGGYTVFARVVGGVDVMDAIVQGDRIVTIRIL